MNNSPAFPTPVIVPEGQFTTITNDGMTLRDYFAAKAMQGYLSNHEWMNQLARTVGEETEQVDDVNAVRAYAAADAMLKMRERSA